MPSKKAQNKDSIYFRPHDDVDDALRGEVIATGIRLCELINYRLRLAYGLLPTAKSGKTITVQEK